MDKRPDRETDRPQCLGYVSISTKWLRVRVGITKEILIAITNYRPILFLVNHHLELVSHEPINSLPAAR